MPGRPIVAVLSAAFAVTVATHASAQIDPPSAHTIARNREAAAAAPFADTRDFEFASRGYLGTRADPIIRGADGRVVWDLSWFDFLKGAAPDSVNPNLWRQSQLTARHGLFEVTNRIYQVRGFDTAYKNGEYSWAAELLNRVVFADANDAAARTLLGRCYQQLAWQAESSLTRNMYLTGALELLSGPSLPSRPGDGGFLDVLPVTDVFDMLATRIDPDKVGESRMRIGFVFPKDEVNLVAQIGNGVLTHRPLRAGETLDAIVTLERSDFLDVVLRGGVLAPKLVSGAVKITGEPAAMGRFVGLFDEPDLRFAIVTP